MKRARLIAVGDQREPTVCGVPRRVKGRRTKSNKATAFTTRLSFNIYSAMRSVHYQGAATVMPARQKDTTMTHNAFGKSKRARERARERSSMFT